MKEIHSNQNPLIKSLRALREKKEREARGRMLAEGEKLIGEALACGLAPFEAIADEAKLERYMPLLNRLEALGAEVYSVPARAIEAVSDTKSPQGIIASVALPARMNALAPPARLVALDGVSDPGNAGTIWRTADAAGFGGVLFGLDSAEPLSPKVQRAAMGSGFRVPHFAGSLPEALARLKEMGYCVVSGALSGADFSARPSLPERAVLVVGSEAHGVSEEVLALSDITLRLPMPGGAESLNAAVAAGIMMYQLNVFGRLANEFCNARHGA